MWASLQGTQAHLKVRLLPCPAGAGRPLLALPVFAQACAPHGTKLALADLWKSLIAWLVWRLLKGGRLSVPFLVGPVAAPLKSFSLKGRAMLCCLSVEWI